MPESYFVKFSIISEETYSVRETIWYVDGLDLSPMVCPSFSQVMLIGGSPDITEHMIDIRIASSKLPGKVNGLNMGGAVEGEKVEQ